MLQQPPITEKEITTFYKCRLKYEYMHWLIFNLEYCNGAICSRISLPDKDEWFRLLIFKKLHI